MDNWKFGGEFKAPRENPENYSIMGSFEGRQVEFVPKSELIKALDQKQRAEEILEHLAKTMHRVISQRLPSINQWESAVRTSWGNFAGNYLSHYLDCKHKHLAIEAKKPEKDSPQLNSFRVGIEDCKVVCLDCNRAQVAQFSFAAAQLKDTAPSVGPQSPDSLDK